MNKNDQKGFTLFETLIAMTVGVTLLGIILAVYLLSLRSLNDSETRAELTQNSRVILERIVRDVRQTRNIATTLPATTLELEDGHDTAVLQYIRYYKNGTDLKRQIRRYYFSDAPSVFVPFDARDDFGNPPQVAILADELVGQYISTIQFSGTDFIMIDLSLAKSNLTQTSRTAAYGRNL